MLTLTAMRGYPASGKSTIARALSAQTSHPVICRDDIRKMHFDKYWGVDEDVITVTEYAAIRALLEAGHSLIVDAQNLAEDRLAELVQIAHAHGAALALCDVPTDVETCVRRDAARDRHVGEIVIRQQAERFPIGTWKPLSELART